MGGIDVHSSTQKIVVSSQQRIVVEDRTVNVITSPQSVAIISAGPPGPPGPSSISFAEGVVTIASLVWILDYPDLGGRPAAFRFFDETGQEWEPEEIVYINDDRSVAQWPEPMLGSWIVS